MLNIQYDLRVWIGHTLIIVVVVCIRARESHSCRETASEHYDCREASSPGDESHSGRAETPLQIMKRVWALRILTLVPSVLWYNYTYIHTHYLYVVSFGLKHVLVRLTIYSQQKRLQKLKKNFFCRCFFLIIQSLFQSTTNKRIWFTYHRIYRCSLDVESVKT